MTRQNILRGFCCWRWFFPVFLLALIAGICTPIQLYLNNRSTFQVTLVQMVPVFLVTFAAVLAVGTAIGLLIQNWRRVKREYRFVVIETLVALVLFICIKNKASEPALLCTGLLMGPLIRIWEQGLLVRKWDNIYNT